MFGFIMTEAVLLIGLRDSIYGVIPVQAPHDMLLVWIVKDVISIAFGDD